MKRYSAAAWLFLAAILGLVSWVIYLQLRVEPIYHPQPVSRTISIKPEDFVIADGGGAEFYQNRLTLWKTAEIAGKATYAIPDTFEYGILTLNLQVRRDVPEANGGMGVKTLSWFWQLRFGKQEDNVPFTVVSDTLDLVKIGMFLVEYSGDPKCNLDVLGGKLQLFKKATP